MKFLFFTIREIVKSHHVVKLNLSKNNFTIESNLK